MNRSPTESRSTSYKKLYSGNERRLHCSNKKRTDKRKKDRGKQYQTRAHDDKYDERIVDTNREREKSIKPHQEITKTEIYLLLWFTYMRIERNRETSFPFFCMCLLGHHKGGNGSLSDINNCFFLHWPKKANVFGLRKEDREPIFRKMIDLIGEKKGGEKG